VVLSLDAPGGDRRVVHGAVDGEVYLHVPLEIVEDGPRAADALLGPWVVRNEVGDDVPVARRGLRLGPVGPELGQHAAPVASLHDVRRIRQAGGGADRMARAVVRAERVVAPDRGGDVDGGAVVGVELAAAAKDVE